MKKLIAGISLLISGVILFAIAYIPSSNYMVTLGGWSTPPGKFVTALIDTWGLFPFITGICLFICGIVLIFWGTFEK